MSQMQRPTFPVLLRYWRGVFALSQEALAERVDSSQRHISRLESGRIGPSRELVARIAEALALSETYAAQLMATAGFSVPTPRPAPHPAQARVLAALDPSPAVLFDEVGRVQMLNRGAAALLGPLAMQPALALPEILDALFSRTPPRRRDARWRQSQHRILLAVEQHITAWGLGDRSMIDRLARAHGLAEGWRARSAGEPPQPAWRLWSTVAGVEVGFDVVTTPLGHSGLAPQGPPGLLLQVFAPLQPDRFAPLVDPAAEPPLLFRLDELSTADGPA